MRASVIIPVKDDPRVLPVAASIVAQLPSDAELIVVNDGAPGSLPEIPGARVIGVHSGNQSLARNTGAAAAQGRVLVFTDADVSIPKSWLATALAAFEDPSLSALQGGSQAMDKGWFGRRIQSRYEAFLESHREAAYADLCDSRCFAIRREIFLRFLFDIEDPWCSDTALGRRLYESGVHTTFVPEWKVGHHYGRSLPAELSRLRRQAQAGAAHRRRTGRDLFRAPGAPEPAGLGGAVLRAARGRPALARVLAGASWSAALAAGAASRVPGRLGFSLFDNACRWVLLSGRLDGEP